MFIRHLKDCEEFTAGDRSLLRELLHPDKADLDDARDFALQMLKKVSSKAL